MSYRGPTRLAPIPWGKRDRETARAVCESLVKMTPPRVIPCNPLKEARLRQSLHHLGIAA